MDPVGPKEHHSSIHPTSAVAAVLASLPALVQPLLPPRERAKATQVFGVIGARLSGFIKTAAMLSVLPDRQGESPKDRACFRACFTLQPPTPKL